MKNLIILFLLSMASHFANGEVTGHAFLEGQENHSGIKVKFIPNSPSAVLDSTYTNVSGSYSIILQPGVYFVTFSKPGYQTLNYNNGSPVLITLNYTLNNVTLLPGNIVYISGPLNGVMTSDTTYIVTSDVYINDEDTLLIEPGTIIKFQYQCDLFVYGLLIANGNVNNKILFTSEPNNPNIPYWGYIFYQSAFNQNLEYCIIEYGQGIEKQGSHLFVDNCEFRYSYNLLYCHGSATILNSSFHNFTGNGIMATDFSSVTIKNNIFEINEPVSYSATGIKAANATVIIENNQIFQSSTSQDPLGIYLENSNALVSNNIVRNLFCGIYSFSSSSGVIVNNNIINNYYIGLWIDESFGVTDWIIRSNNIFGNADGLKALIDEPCDISYNNVWGNDNNYNSSIPGIGQIFTVNNNGDPCDPYLNISMNPFFVDTANFNFHVYEGSPVIDAGSNSNVISQFDLDGNPRILDGNGDGSAIVDMGVYEVPVELILTSDFSCPDSVCANDDVTIQYLGNVIAGATFNWDFNDGTIASGSGPGPYQIYWAQSGIKTISLFVTLGYNSSDTTYNTIEVLPVFDVSITINASSNPICFGDEVTFTAFPVNGGETPSFQWKLNTQNVGTNSPVYTNSELQDGDMVHCLLHSSEECAFQGWMMSNVVVMDVYNYPDVSIEASPNDTACITQTITLNAGNPGCDYFWSTGETTQSIVVSNTSGPSGGTQTYFVEVIKGGICSGYDTTSVYFDPCTGIEDLTAASGINIFPNPSHEEFYIQIKEIINPVSIALFTSQGILMEEFKFIPSESNSPFKMNLGNYPDGIYFLKFQNEEKFEVRKIIKN